MPVITQPSYYTINQVRYQFASLEINFGIPGFGTPTLGLQSIDYDDNLEPGELRGTSPAVLASTTGKYSTSAKLKIPKAEATFLTQALNAFAFANPDPSTGLVMGYGQVQWTATLNYYDIGQPLQTDQLFGAKIKKMADAGKVGNEPLYVYVDLFLMALSRNGNFMVNPLTVGAVWLGSDI
jgi:hypothetical protein